MADTSAEGMEEEEVACSQSLLPELRMSKISLCYSDMVRMMKEAGIDVPTAFFDTIENKEID
eukprot:693487-Rhodomonas_salina.2